MDDVGCHRRSTTAHAAVSLLAACRKTPALARALHFAMDAGRSSEDWYVRFTRAPRWGRFAREVRTAFDLPDDASKLASAHYLRSIALVHEIGSAECVFWNALVRNETPRVLLCRKLLEESESAHRYSAQSPGIVPLADYRRNRWIQVADREHARSQLRIADAASQLLAAATTEAFQPFLTAFLEMLHGGPVSLWLPDLPMSRDQFEAELLSPHFRFARELPGDPQSRLYSTFPLQIPRRWKAVVVNAVAVHSATRQSAAFSQVDWKSLADRHVRSAIAEFAAGAGHEINNPLGAIKGQALQLMPAESHPARRESLRKILQQVDRIHRMIRDLHLVGREGRSAGSPQRLVEILDAAVSNVAGRRAVGELKLLPCSPRLFVKGDRAELARVVVEVVQNAAEAAGERGSVAVSAHTVDGRVEIVVVDSGPGFSEVDRRHAFTPFFSGRQAGRGLGMGLPVGQKLLRDHGGSLEIHDVRPTTVVIRLPLVEEQAERAAA